MNTQERTLPNVVIILVAVTIAIGAIVAAVSLGMLGGSPQATAAVDNHGACTEGVTSIDPDSADLATYDAGSDIVTLVCLKAGNTETHASFDQDVAGDCYTVSGIGTSNATVERTGEPGPDCQEISHIDVIVEAPTPTPTPTPTATPTGTLTPTPTSTPEVLAAVQEPEVLAAVQEPEALPASGGAPADGSNANLALLLGLGGLALLSGAGTLVAVAARRRR